MEHSSGYKCPSLSYILFTQLSSVTPVFLSFKPIQSTNQTNYVEYLWGVTLTTSISFSAVVPSNHSNQPSLACLVARFMLQLRPVTF